MLILSLMLQGEPGRFGANNNFDFSLFKAIVLYHTFMILNGAFVSFLKLTNSSHH